MIIKTNVRGPGNAPERLRGERLIASIDVEWQKNYRVRDGNRAFCYSVVWMTILEKPRTIRRPSFGYTSVYLNPDEDSADLAEVADVDLHSMLDRADFIVGHQLCSDLAVLAANARTELSNITRIQRAWHDRRTIAGKQRIIDTRFDVGHMLSGVSRRLVDVCDELNLDVTQPELAQKSMTALHRDWIDTGATEARERIAVLNLRHSLSTALVALRAIDAITWSGILNVNQSLNVLLIDTFAWLEHPIFRELLSTRES